ECFSVKMAVSLPDRRQMRKNRRWWQMKNKKRMSGRTRRIILLAAFILVMIWIVTSVVRHFIPRKDAGNDPENTVPAQESPVAGASAEPASVENPSGDAAAADQAGAADDAEASDAGAAAADQAGAAAAEDSDAGAAAGEAAGPEEGTAAGSTTAEAAPEEHRPTEVEKGREYLAGLEEREPVEVEVKIDEARAAYAAKKEWEAYQIRRESYRQTLEGDAVWASFDDYVFLGDSRVVGFSLYGFLPQDRVLAETGDTIAAIRDRLEEIRSLSPKYIFISYGINDIGCGLWPEADLYEEEFTGILQTLKDALPEAEIYVNSILPASEEAIAYAPLWGRLPEYSEALRRASAEQGASFIDNTSLVEEHGDLYAGDGVHVQPDFYRYWAENQLLGVYDKHNNAPEAPEEASSH
ncbi:MAG: GDSL-type esterase/lipase family protein, partial [Eubacteriales bacterium]|nr:GDSL-type esterase/lipase family protein [Eubacteriales bacterium]